MEKLYLKRLILIIMILPLFFIGACSNRTASGMGAEQINLKIGINLDEDSSHGEASKLFKERVEELSEGRLNVQLYPNQQLGDMRAQIEQVQSGALEMTIQGTSTLSNFAKPLEIIELPFLFPDEEVMWEVLSGETGQEILSELENVNMVGLSYFSQGFRHITADIPIKSPEDIKGIKFRTMPSDLLINTWSNWGANAVSVDLGELYNGLQQGVVDSEDNNLETIKKLSLYEVQDYLTISGHNFLSFAIVTNKDWFEGLPEDLQEIVREAAMEAGKYSVDYMLESDKESFETLSEEMTVYELTDEEKEVFREASRALYEKYSSNGKNKAYIDKIIEAVENATSN